MKNKEKEVTTRKTIFQRALNLAKTPIIIALFVTPIRFFLELSGLPESVIFIIGLLWLSLVFAICWGIKLYNKKRSYLILLLSLIIFSPISRFPVSVLWWIDTKWEIGTHYGFYFNNFGQAILNQVVYGSLIQIIPGFLLGSITLAIDIAPNARDINEKNGLQNGRKTYFLWLIIMWYLLCHVS